MTGLLVLSLSCRLKASWWMNLRVKKLIRTWLYHRYTRNNLNCLLMSPNLCIRLSVLELQRPHIFSQSWNSCPPPAPAMTLPRQMALVSMLRSFPPAELCLHVEQQHRTVAIFSTEDASSKPYPCLSLLRQVHISISQELATCDKFKNVIETQKEKK